MSSNHPQRIVATSAADESTLIDLAAAHSSAVFPRSAPLRHGQSAPFLPFVAATFAHLAERLGDVRARSASVEGLSRETILRWKTAAHSFLQFLETADTARQFLAGDFRLQGRIVENWIGSLRERKLSRAAIATYFRSLDAQFRRIEQEDGVLNPLSLIPAPKPGAPLPRSLTREQAERVMTYLRNRITGTPLERARNLCAVGLMLFAGLRRSEVLTLHVADCNLSNGTLTVRNGKGRNGGRARTSYMTPQLQGIIVAYVELRAKAKPERTHPELLTSIVGDQAMGRTCLSRLFAYVRRATGIYVTPHMLRHTYALLLRQAGIPDRVSMDLLGHRSLSMLQRYSHVFDGEHQREAAKLHLDLDVPSAAVEAAP